jgi:serine/threonine protein kinase
MDSGRSCYIIIFFAHLDRARALRPAASRRSREALCHSTPELRVDDGRIDRVQPVDVAPAHRVAGMLGKSVGNYVIERPLGRGGMGEVYLARHPRLGREAAIKLLDASLSHPDLVARFFDEAKITASLKHPNVVEIFDFGEVEGRLYYLMELLRGKDLAQELAERGTLPLPLAVDFLRQTCLGLSEVHRAGIVHRDLKPANIFVLDGEPYQIKLTDFGIAKNTTLTTRGTSHGQVLGTPVYMSPEQALGQIDRVSPQSDLYSLGIIAHELLTGEPPFTGDSPVQILIRHVQEPPPRLAQRLSGLPPEFVELIDACLAKEPSARPKSAAAIANSLKAVLAKLVPAIEEAPTSLWNRGRAPQKTDAATAPARIDFDKTLLEPKPSAAYDPTLPMLAPLIIDAPRPEPVTNAALIPGPSSIAPVSVDKSHAENNEPVRLSKSDRDVFTKLLARMQRRGDMPAFVANVGEVSAKADFESKYSATQLGGAILKDYALTAKLLRTVNTLYAARFGVRIHTVSHAIVILGFERVRSIALSISVFNKATSRDQEARATDSAIHALVSGELARELAEMSSKVDPEQAMLCSMFRNLGRHLMIVYLPETYLEILGHAQERTITEDAAATTIVGISLRKIGLGVAEQWNLPPHIGKSMSHETAAQSALADTSEQRLAALSQLSNELSDLVALGLDSTHHTRLQALLDRHHKVVHLTAEELSALLGRVQDSFRAHYGSLLGKKVHQSQFLVNLRALVPQHKAGTPDAVAGPRAAKRGPKAHSLAPIPGHKQAAAAPPALRVEKLKLGAKGPTDPQNEDPIALEAKRIAQLLEGGSTHKSKVLEMSLALAAEVLGVSRVWLLAANDNRHTLNVAAGIGEDALAIGGHLKVELQRGSLDVFSKAYFMKKDYLVRDSFTKQKSQPIPPIYFELIGSPAFALLACDLGQNDVALLLADVPDTEMFPSDGACARLLPVRRLIARAL